ncbi:MAG: hypothetical protein BWY92_01377 [Firmicutes bacterium ADurb.BinA052]|nr:MAG: hypothetical protein BWY92_01377 [Firmicutes bacterium ADurb.BinA052]
MKRRCCALADLGPVFLGVGRQLRSCLLVIVVELELLLHRRHLVAEGPVSAGLRFPDSLDLGILPHGGDPLQQVLLLLQSDGAGHLASCKVTLEIVSLAIQRISIRLLPLLVELGRVLGGIDSGIDLRLPSVLIGLLGLQLGIGLVLADSCLQAV